MIWHLHLRSRRFNILVLFLCVILTGAFARADDSTLSNSSDDSMTDIAEAEKEALRLMGERWRVRHHAEYNNPEIAKLRVENKRVEKDMLDVRREFQGYMRARYPEIRAMEKTVRGSFARVAELRGEEELALREKRMADDGVPVSTTDDEERAARILLLRKQIVEAEEQANESRAELEARRIELASTEAVAGAMLDELRLLEAEYETSLREMSRRIETLPAMQEHDEVRARKMNRVHDPRRQQRETYEVDKGL